VKGLFRNASYESICTYDILPTAVLTRHNDVIRTAIS
jgi:hypothetical protein